MPTSSDPLRPADQPGSRLHAGALHQLTLRQVLDTWTRFRPASLLSGSMPAIYERKYSFCYHDTVISSELERVAIFRR